MRERFKENQGKFLGVDVLGMDTGDVSVRLQGIRNGKALRFDCAVPLPWVKSEAIFMERNAE